MKTTNKYNVTVESPKAVEYLNGLNRFKRGEFIRYAINSKLLAITNKEKRNTEEQSICDNLNASSPWYAVRSQLELLAKTYSDRGCVIVGNKSCATYIHNGLGDGVTRVGYIKQGNKALKLMTYDNMYYFGEGCGIYDYDCVDIRTVDPIESINSGWYDVYRYDGIVALVKLENFKPFHEL